MSNEELESIDLGFTRDEQLSPEKLKAFERALEHSFGLYRTGLRIAGSAFEGVSNKHIKVTLATANTAANMVLDALEQCGGVVVMDREFSVGMLLPWMLAGCELLNIDNGGSSDETKNA